MFNSKNFFLQLFLSRSCNQTCSYCTTYKGNYKYLSDLKFIKEISKFITKDFFIEITGGEPGLCDNLIDIINIIKETKATIRIMSNGLVRKRYPEIISDPSVWYFEHLYLDSNKKFYNLEPFEENNLNNVNVIVLTSDIMDNLDISKLTHKNTWFKVLNLKSKDETLNIKKTRDFLNSLNKTFNQYDFNLQSNNKKTCALNPPNPFIYIEERKIGHCAKILTDSLLVDYSEKNFKKLLKSELFTDYPNYCDRCNDVAGHRINNILSSKNNIPKNT